MNKKILSFLTLVSLLFFQGVVAQNSTVSGTVSDDSGSPLPGVNVVEKAHQMVPLPILTVIIPLVWEIMQP